MRLDSPGTLAIPVVHLLDGHGVLLVLLGAAGLSQGISSRNVDLPNPKPINPKP